MLTLNASSGMKVLELGGGANRNPSTTFNVDCRKVDGVDAVWDFEKDLPTESWTEPASWDSVISVFCLEHLRYQTVPSFLKRVYSLVKPGGKVVFIIPNTEAQMHWIKEHPDGWDGKPAFECISENLFGTLDYPENSHKSYYSPVVAEKLFTDAGFTGIEIRPYGEYSTDQCVVAVREAVKPTVPVESNGQLETVSPALGKDPAEVFDFEYFNGQAYKPYYGDYPWHEITFRHVLSRRPESVFSVGEAKGYIIKRLQDVGIPAFGIDVSKHCYMARVCEGLYQHDACKTPWDFVESKSIDLCMSMDFLPYIPEECLGAVISEMERISKRGLHGVTFADSHDIYDDKCRLLIKPREWWRERLPKSHELYSRIDLEQAPLPPDYTDSDGRLKLNIGCYCTMFHRGWQNLDIKDCTKFVGLNGYAFTQCDITNALPYKTGEVDLIFAHHILEHLKYKDGLTHLRDCRRVIKPTGCMRIAVPNAEHMISLYSNTPDGLDDWMEINRDVTKSRTTAEKLWHLLFDGHQAIYDEETLLAVLDEAGWHATKGAFRCTPDLGSVTDNPGFAQIQRECIECSYGGFSLFVDAVPKVGEE